MPRKLSAACGLRLAPIYHLLIFTVFVACAALICFASVSAAQSPATDEPAANPGRPTVSTPATLTPVGYLQFETGVQGARHSPERIRKLPHCSSFA